MGGLMPARSSVVYAVCVVLLLQAWPGFIAPSAAQAGCIAQAIESTITPPATDPTPRGEAKSAGLAITVGPDGAVRNVRITRSSQAEKLDGAALAHVRSHWRYQPLHDGCGGAEVRANIHFPVIGCIAEPLRETQTVPETEPLEPGQGRSAQMQVTVDADGKVENVVISRSSGLEALDKAGMAHVQAHWRWQPSVCPGAGRQSRETWAIIDFPVLVPPAAATSP